MLYMGVDLKTSTKQQSSLTVVDSDSFLTFIGSFSDDQGLFEVAERFNPQFIAIGSPLSLPTGLCCLEPACDCRMESPDRKGRQAELELARMGISCFFTNKGSIIRKLVYRAVALNQQLSEMGHRLIEVYPHATKVVLFGDKVPSKNRPESLPFMKARLPDLIDGLDPYMDVLDRSSCDALMNAHTAMLHAREETDQVGSASEGFIALPKLVRI
jgi:predicted nuclease with RNAse H fold